MTDLYGLLGIERSASQAEIKTAYRRQAAAHHPDKGGDVRQFLAIKKAYEILSDAEARNHFDTTGETPEMRLARKQTEAQFKAIAAEFMMGVVQRTKVVPLSDLVQQAKHDLVAQIAAIEQSLRGYRETAAKLNEARARLTCLSGDDLLGQALQEKQAEINQSIANGELQRDQWIRLRNTLDQYRFKTAGSYEVADEALV